MDATAKTFRYLDEEEIAAQRKAAAARPRQGGQEMMRATLVVIAASCARARGVRRRAARRTCGSSSRTRTTCRAGAFRRCPRCKPYEPFTYNAFDLTDPFKPRKIEPPQGRGGGRRHRPGPQPPQGAARGLSRSRTCKMVGTLQQKKEIYALVKTPDNTLFRVKPGNYVGPELRPHHRDFRIRDQAEGNRPGQRRRLERRRTASLLLQEG